MANDSAGLTNPEIREDVLSRSDALSLNLDDDRVVEIIGRRIESGTSFFEKELKLAKVRQDNERRWMNENFEVGGNSLYNWQTEYRDNRIFISVETLASQTVSKIPFPEVVEANDTDASRELATNYGKVLFRKAEDMMLKGHLQMVARHLLMGFRVGIMKATWDFDGGRLKDDNTFTGEVAVNAIRPQKVVFDEEADDPMDIPLIAENVSKSVEELGNQFPGKKDKILKLVSAEKGKGTMLNTKIGHWEVYFSFFDSDGIKQEGLAWKYKSLLLDYGINPYFNYDSEQTNKSNFFERPRKPYILFNFLRSGRWVYDDTSLTEQAASQQDILEKRGRQIVEAADKAESTKVFNTMMIDAGDAQKYTGDPRKNILSRGDVRQAFARIPPQELPKYVIEDKYDARREIDNLFGTHAPLRGEKSKSPTLGQEVMSQKADLGRTSPLVEAMEVGALQVYKHVTQLLKVFGTEEHIVKYVGPESGHTTFVKFSGDKIEDGVEIRLQHGSMNPDDKLTDRTEALELAKVGGRIDPLTFAEKWHVDKPREFAKRLFYFLFMPDKYATEILQLDQPGGDSEAMQTIQRINSGESVPPKEGASKEYVAMYNQFLQAPAFKQLDPIVQRLHAEHIRGTVAAVRGELKTGEGKDTANKKPSLVDKIKGVFQKRAGGQSGG